MAAGTEPRWKGTLTACATVSPAALQTAAEKSMPSRTTVECAVRWIVVAISSATDASAFATSCCVIGSIRVLATLEHQGVRLPVARDRPSGRDDDGRVVLVDEQRPRL